MDTDKLFGWALFLQLVGAIILILNFALPWGVVLSGWIMVLLGGLFEIIWVADNT